VTALLEIDEVCLRFGGVVALDGVSASVGEGEVLAVIGPNGAGKTSLLNCLSGVYRPQRGSVRLGGTELLGRRPAAIAALGVARTFQNLGLFGRLDVVENLLLGRHLHMRSGFVAGLAWLGRARREDRENRAAVAGVVDLLGLGQYAGRPVATLPYGVQKRIELGRALAMEPRLLLLDEPVAGTSPAERIEMGDAVRRACEQLDVTVVLIEHDLGFVADLADDAVVLDFGRVIAHGTPAEVRADPEVVAAYLGPAIEAR
jgi:branched-chain amino acid transport system ATP-binding protein